MHDALAVKMVQRLGQGDEQGKCAFESQTLALPQFGQRATFDEGHDCPQPGALRHHVVDRSQGGVSDAPAELGFIEEALTEVGVQRDVGMDELDDDFALAPRPAVVRMSGAEHPAHASSTHRLTEPVAADALG